MNKKPFILDERDLNIFRRICTVLYILTIYSMMGILYYRQFVLDQPSEEWNDIVILMTINILTLLGALVYVSGIVNFRKIKLWHFAAGYLLFFLLGFSFTIFKYAILLDQELSNDQVMDFFFLDLKISGILVLILALLAYLGNRRIEKQIA